MLRLTTERPLSLHYLLRAELSTSLPLIMVQAPVKPSYGNGSVISVKRELVSIGAEAFIQDDEIKEGALELTQIGLSLFCILIKTTIFVQASTFSRSSKNNDFHQYMFLLVHL